jgi:hypothetical protein
MYTFVQYHQQFFCGVVTIDWSGVILRYPALTGLETLNIIPIPRAAPRAFGSGPFRAGGFGGKFLSSV